MPVIVSLSTSFLHRHLLSHLPSAQPSFGTADAALPSTFSCWSHLMDEPDCKFTILIGRRAFLCCLWILFFSHNDAVCTHLGKSKLCFLGATNTDVAEYRNVKWIHIRRLPCKGLGVRLVMMSWGLNNYQTNFPEIYCKYFADSLTFHLAPPSGQNFTLTNIWPHDKIKLQAKSP